MPMELSTIIFTSQNARKGRAAAITHGLQTSLNGREIPSLRAEGGTGAQRKACTGNAPEPGVLLCPFVGVIKAAGDIKKKAVAAPEGRQA